MQAEKLLIIPDKRNIENSLKLAEKYGCGFEYNDFFLPEVLDNEEAVENSISLYRGLTGLPAYCTSHGAFFDVLIFSDDARIREISDYRVKQSLEIAVKLGARGVVFHTNYTPNFHLSSYRNGWVERNYSYWAEKLEQYPTLNIYMENMFDTDAELLAGLGERLSDRRNFGVCFDYAHACVFGDETKIDDWVKILAPYVKHLHINDNDFKADLHLALGEGRIDWNRFRQYYENYFMGASVLIETTGQEKIEKSLEFFQKL